MKTYSSALTAYRAAGKAYSEINFISFQVKDLTDPGEVTWFHFCSDEDDRNETVINPNTGGSVTRLFLGGGHLVSIDPVVRSEGAVVRSHNLVLSGASPTVQNMVHGYNCQDALFQRFVGEIDQDTGLLIDTPVCEFVGLVNTIDLNDGALPVDGTGPAETAITVTVDSLAAALLTRNYAMRSLEQSRLRDGDEIFKYADEAHHWSIRWGKESRSHADRRGSESDGKRTADPHRYNR